MDIVIPSVLSGGLGRAMQEAAQGMGVAARKVTQQLQAIDDQQNLIAGQRLENDMLFEKNAARSEILRGADGTDPNTLTMITEKDNEIGQKYVDMAGNPAISNYLTRAHLSSQHIGINGAQKILEEKLWNSSVEASKIYTDTEIRKSLATGQFESGRENLVNYYKAQSGYFGANTGAIATGEIHRFTENYMRGMLSNPKAAPFFVEQLSDPARKQMFYDNLPANKIDEMERLLHSAGQEAIAQNAFAAIYNDPRFQSGGKFTPQTAISTIFTPDGMQQFGLTPATAGVVAQMIQHNDNALKQAKQDIQNQNLDRIYQMIPDNPVGALRAIKARITTGEIDPKEGAQLYRSLESGMLQNNIMAAQLGVFDVQAAIVSGKITERNDVVAAVSALGPGATKDLPGLLTLLEGSSKKRGGVNYFSEVDKELDARVSETKGKNSKEEKRIENNEVKKTLLDWMNKNNVEVDNPAVMTHYRELIKAKAKWGEKVKDAVVDFIVPSEKKPSADEELLQQRATAKRGEATKTQYAEAQIRQWLKEKKIKNIDEQVEIYRKNGYIKK